MKKDDIYLRHILDAAAHIGDFLQSISKEEFHKNLLVQSAAIRQLEIVGEAVKNLSSGFKKTNKHIPWRDIAGLRDKLIHQYFGVDVSLIWEVCQREIPQLRKQISDIIQK